MNQGMNKEFSLWVNNSLTFQRPNHIQDIDLKNLRNTAYGLKSWNTSDNRLFDFTIAALEHIILCF